jgi:hypothetical protein
MVRVTSEVGSDGGTGGNRNGPWAVPSVRSFDSESQRGRRGGELRAVNRVWRRLADVWPRSRQQPKSTRGASDSAERGVDACSGVVVLRGGAVRAGGGGLSDFNSTPTEARGCVYIGSAQSAFGVPNVFALNADTGQLAWKVHLDVAAAGLGGAVVGAVTASGPRSTCSSISSATAPVTARTSRLSIDSPARRAGSARRSSPTPAITPTRPRPSPMVW